MSDTQEFFSNLRMTLADQGVNLPDAHPEDLTSYQPAFHAGPDASGPALFELEQHGLTPAAIYGGAAVLGNMQIR